MNYPSKSLASEHLPLTSKPLTEYSLSQEQLQRVYDFMDTYLSNKIRLEELATLINTKPTYFSKQFKRATGLPPHQYLLWQRLEKAKALLRHSKLSVAEVSQLAGFFDQSHLVRYFKARVGTTPQHYRNSTLEDSSVRVSNP